MAHNKTLIAMCIVIHIHVNHLIKAWKFNYFFVHYTLLQMYVWAIKLLIISKSEKKQVKTYTLDI